MYSKEIKAINGRKPGKAKDVSTPHCIYDTDPFQIGAISDKDMLQSLTIELPDTYKPPSIDSCLTDDNMPKSAEVIKAVNSVTDQILKDSAAAGLTRDIVKCLNVYTYDYKPASKGFGFGGSKDSKDKESESNNTVRKRINNVLKERNPFGVVKGRGYLVSFLTALRKLPHTEKFAFYCGVKEKISNESKFKYGSLISCKFFLTCSTDPDSIKEMLNYTGTLFIIRGDPWAYDIRPFSFYPNEQEFVFEFGSQFKVTKVINGPINTIEMALNKVQNYDLTSLVPIPGYTYAPPESSKPAAAAAAVASSSAAATTASQPQQKPEDKKQENDDKSPSQVSSLPQVPQQQQQQQLQQPVPVISSPPQVPQQQQQQQPPKIQGPPKVVPKVRQTPPVGAAPTAPKVQTVPKMQSQFYSQQHQKQMQQMLQYQTQSQQIYLPQQQQQQYAQQYAQQQQQQQQHYVSGAASTAVYTVNHSPSFAYPGNHPMQNTVAPAMSVAGLQNYQQHHQQYQQQQQQQQYQQNNLGQSYQGQYGNPQAGAPRQNNLAPAKSVYNIQAALASSASLNVRKDGTVPARITNAATKIRDPSLNYYIEGCKELANIILENNTKETKDVCVSIMVIESIISGIEKMHSNREICLAAYTVLSLLSDGVPDKIVGYFEFLEETVEEYPKDPEICTLWCGILLNFFRYIEKYQKVAFEDEAGGSFDPIKAIIINNGQDPQVCDIVSKAVIEHEKAGFFDPRRSALIDFLIKTFLNSLSADRSLSCSVCSAIAVLLPHYDISLGKESYALLVNTVQERAGFFEDLHPALIILNSVAERNDPELINNAGEFGLAPILVNLLGNYSENSVILDVCLALSHNLVKSNQQVKNELIQYGFIQSAINAIRNHGAAVPSICVNGLNSLLVLSMVPAAIQIIVASNGTTLLFEIARSPIATEFIMQSIWGICSWIAANDSSIVLNSAGGGDAIIGLFEKYKSNPLAVEFGLMTIMYIVQSCREMDSCITSPQVISLFASVLDSYKENQSVCSPLSFIILKIAELLGGSGIEACISNLLLIIYNYNTNKSIVENVCSTLQKVALSIINGGLNNSLVGTIWASCLCGALEKNYILKDSYVPIIIALETLSRLPDPANLQEVATHMRLFVVALGNSGPDTVTAQCASSVIKNVISVNNAVQMLASTNETYPAIVAALKATGNDKIVFINCSYILKVLIGTYNQLFQAFTQSGCAETFYGLYVAFKSSDPAVASEGSWIETYIRHD